MNNDGNLHKSNDAKFDKLGNLFLDLIYYFAS